jgi:hypothetical protein
MRLSNRRPLRDLRRHTCLHPVSVRVALATAAITSLALVSAPTGNATPLPSPALAQRSGTTGPSVRSHETASTAVVTGGGIVTLVTGDRVRVTMYSDGRSQAVILPGSPHFGRPVNTVRTPNASYVIPWLPLRERMRLDVSLFNVTALLGRQGHEIKVSVRFAPGVRTHAVPGLDLDSGHAQATSDGSTVVAAHYSTSTTGVDSAPAAWRGVSSVTLPGGGTGATPTTYRLHTLTIHVVSKQGGPVRFEQAWVINMDNGRLFLQPLYIIKGVGKISVPTGNYAVVAGSFIDVLMKTDIAVRAATTVDMSLADATVRPAERVPGRAVTDAGLDLTAIPDGGGGFGFSIGSDHFVAHVQPVSKVQQHGAIWSTVSGTFAPASQVPAQIYRSLAYTKDYRRGVPSSMSFTHPRADFAIVPQKFYANGPTGTRSTFVFSFAPFEFFGFATGYEVRVPSARTVWLQGSVHLTWDQSYNAIESFGRDFKIATLDKISTYTRGAARPVSFAHGPVGPGLEAAYDRGSTGPFCILCRRGDNVRGFLPLFSGAGTAMLGVLWAPSMGSWRLSHGFHTWGSGHIVVTPHTTLPPDSQRYTLTASSHPGSSDWQLSTKVSDVWRFTSGTADAVLPLLMPSYLPRTALNGTLRPGHVRWPLDFGNLGPADAPVTTATVSLSTNGGHTWRPATVTRVDKNSFAVTYTNPASSGSPAYMSLRVTGTDSAGRTVSETAIRAYRLVPAGDAQPTTLGPQVAGLGTHACAAPTNTRVSCLALVMSDQTGALLAGGEPAGWGATDLEDAYDIPNLHSHQTVAVVVAYDYPTAEADLATYRRHFGLPPCTSDTGCFTKINQRGVVGKYPDPDQGWSVEAALDLEMISAACPSCHIILAEADQPYDRDLAATTDAAVAAGAVVTNHSYGISEHTGVRYLNDSYDHKGVTAVAATGDYGYGGASFPASSPNVIAVGGTVLHHADNARGWRENAWSYGGSGCSAYFTKRSYQHDKACQMRTYADLSAVAYGVAVYNSYALGPHRAWLEVAGTSISSPLVAGLVGAAHAGGVKPGSLYGTPSNFHDVRLGSNGFCQGSYLCTAKPGYDGPTGWGTPRGLAPFSVG